MRGNSFGRLFSITSFGESHGEALGVVIDGMPAKIQVDINKLIENLDKRRPGRLEVSTSRCESDTPEILSGIFENQTLGTPICVIVRNTSQRSSDYDALKEEYRPGHADKTTIQKFGIRDHRGGGRASGRETLSRVIAGYFASLIISHIKISAKIIQIGQFSTDKESKNDSFIGLKDSTQDKKVQDYLLGLKKNGESCGGRIEVIIKHCDPGLGSPVFDKLKADFSKAMLSIGTCVAFGIGLSENFSTLLGSEVSKESKNFGGIEGGISNGEDIKMELTFKAPSTIGEKAKKGRHDPCILPRVLPVVESMAFIVLADHYLCQNAYQLERP